jgi:hypothetical protein
MRRLARAAIGAKETACIKAALFGNFVDASLGGVSTIYDQRGTCNV